MAPILYGGRGRQTNARNRSKNAEEMASAQLIRESNMATEAGNPPMVIMSTEKKSRSPAVVRFEETSITQSGQQLPNTAEQALIHIDAGTVNRLPPRAKGKLSRTTFRANGAHKFTPKDSLIRQTEPSNLEHEADIYSVPSSPQTMPSTQSERTRNQARSTIQNSNGTATHQRLNKEIRASRHEFTENTASSSGSEQPNLAETIRSSQPSALTFAGNDDELSLTSSDEEEVFQFAEWPALKRSFEFAEKIRADWAKRRVKSKAIEELVRFCEESIPALGQIDFKDEKEVDQYLSDLMDGVEERISPWGKQTQSVNKDIYLHLLPSLTLLFKAVLTAFHNTNPQSTEGRFEPVTLRELTDFTEIIFKVHNSTEMWTFKSPAFQKIAATIDRRLIAPLKKVQEIFSTKLENLERKSIALRRRQKQQRKAQRLLEQEERRLQEEMEAAAKSREWHQLHVARLAAEPDPWKFPHLRMQERGKKEDDYDANGIPFERVEVFTAHHANREPRPSDHIGDMWRDEEILALLEGLEHLAGPHVFERIFQYYCTPGGPLRCYNVTEITQKAAYLRAVLVEVDQREGRSTDEWILQIPVFE